MTIANTQAETIIKAGIIDDNDQTQARVEHLRELEKLVGNSYPNKFDRSRISGAEDSVSNLLAFEPIIEIVKELKDATPAGEKPNQELKDSLNQKLKAFGNARISGRLAVPPRVMGKAAFVHLSDGKNRLQIYVRRDDAKAVLNTKSEPPASAGSPSPDNSGISTDAPVDNSAAVTGWDVFKLLDHGDFIGVEGFLFLTNTGELSVHVETLQFLSKALLPMPDKMHGIADPELRRRYRYADLIASSLQVEHEGLTTREVFERRAKLISGMRRFLDDAGYIEVETPMLTPKATGAAAKPFETHHNALDIPLYARIAPELYLKRLTVGGFEKVYELNRNFRNEGLSQKHNPEFTMLEFYCSYMDVNGMMDFAEKMLQKAVKKATGGSLQINYTKVENFFVGESDKQEVTINFEKFDRLTMKDSISKILRRDMKNLLFIDFDEAWLDDVNFLTSVLILNRLDSADLKKGLINRTFRNVENIADDKQSLEEFNDLWKKAKEKALDDTDVNIRKLKESKEKLFVYIFEAIVESELINPTFITDYPKAVSPLSKASPENPNIAERFELFINGMECANGFSELNDPQEQYERFVDQMKERETGDEEAMVLDEDYIRALAYGMPPAAGIGIGIDRLVMLLTNKHSIRDVIMFPHMRPILKEEGEKVNEGDGETVGQ